ncbi:MAG: hypothetical protein OXU75_05000 [Deltaproteobacteria bacterium]|nr:hypothetical protein [Deltaproteobacteria bacterium]
MTLSDEHRNEIADMARKLGEQAVRARKLAGDLRRGTRNEMKLVGFAEELEDIAGRVEELHRYS